MTSKHRKSGRTSSSMVMTARPAEWLAFAKEHNFDANCLTSSNLLAAVQFVVHKETGTVVEHIIKQNAPTPPILVLTSDTSTKRKEEVKTEDIIGARLTAGCAGIHFCRKCGGSNLTCEMVQSRSADEPCTENWYCEQCGPTRLKRNV